MRSPAPGDVGDPSPEPNNRWWSSLQVRSLIVVLAIGSMTVVVWAVRAWQSRFIPVIRSLSVSNQTAGALRLKGTTQAVQTRAILAPLLAGEQMSTLTITKLQPRGSHVKQGDLLVEFDSQTQLRNLIDKQAESSGLADKVLEEQAKEDAAQAKDETEIKVAESALSRAELELQKVELLSRIDAEKAQQSLEEARATLLQLRQTFGLKRKAAQASIRILAIQRDRSHETMSHAEANAALMQVRSPIDGIVVLNTIWKQGNMGVVQEGDQVRPGVPFMQVVDPSTMEVLVPVNQVDFLSLKSAQKALVRLDAYPDLVCPGELQAIDPMGQNGAFSPKVRTFSAVFSVRCSDPRLMPGLSAAVDVEPSVKAGMVDVSR